MKTAKETNEMGARTGAQAGRWFAMLDRLANARGGLTIGELAADFNCAPRTIYRDLEVLQERLGVPLVCDRDEGEAASGTSRWKLMEGNRYRAPLEFTPAELLALFAAEKLMEPLLASPYGNGVRTLQAKLRARLPAATIQYVVEDGASFQVGLPARRDYARHAAMLELLRRAIRDRTTIEMRYASLSGGQETTRRLDPYRIWFADDTLYLVGGCHVHGGRVRTFCLDRLKKLTLTADRFTIPADFKWKDFQKNSFRLFHGTPERVVIHFSAAIAPLIRERPWHPSQQLIELPGGDVGLALTVAGLPEVTHWILSFGAHAKPVSPAALVIAVRREVEQMHAAFTCNDAATGTRRLPAFRAARSRRR